MILVIIKFGELLLLRSHIEHSKVCFIRYPNTLKLVKKKGKIPPRPAHTTLCIQFLGRENNNKNNTSPLGKQICFTIAWGCAEILPKKVKFPHSPKQHYAFSSCEEKTMTKTIHRQWENIFVLQ